MARTVTDSFEGGHLYRMSNSISNGGGIAIATSPIIDGARCLNTGNLATTFFPIRYNGSGLATTATELYVGFFFISTLPFSNSSNTSGSPSTDKHRLISFWDGGDGLVTVSIDPLTQNLRLMLGAYYYFDATSGQVGTTPPLTLLQVSTQGQAITANTIYHIQVRVKLDGVSSIVQVKLDDALVIDWTGTLTSTTMDRIALQSAGARFSDTDGTQYVDDLVINDTVAGTCGDDTWPGVLRFKVQLISGPGTYAQFTPDPAAANYTNVDDLPNDGNTTTNYALTTGLKDSFPVAPHGLLAANVTFRALFQEAIYRKSAGTMQIKLGVRRAGTDYIMASGVNAGVSFDVVDNRLCVDPASLVSWTAAGLDATEIIYQSA